MFVFIPGSIWPVRFGPAGTVPAEIPIRTVIYMYLTDPVQYIFFDIHGERTGGLSK